MNPYIEALKKYVAEQKPNYGESDMKSLLDFLWYVYTDLNPIDSDTIRKKIAYLKPVMDSLSFENANLVFDTLCDIWAENERLAFREGIHVGVRLREELGENDRWHAG